MHDGGAATAINRTIRLKQVAHVHTLVGGRGAINHQARKNPRQPWRALAVVVTASHRLGTIFQVIWSLHELMMKTQCGIFKKNVISCPLSGKIRLASTLAICTSPTCPFVVKFSLATCKRKHSEAMFCIFLHQSALRGNLSGSSCRSSHCSLGRTHLEVCREELLDEAALHGYNSLWRCFAGGIASYVRDELSIVTVALLWHG